MVFPTLEQWQTLWDWLVFFLCLCTLGPPIPVLLVIYKVSKGLLHLNVYLFFLTHYLLKTGDVAGLIIVFASEFWSYFDTRVPRE